MKWGWEYEPQGYHLEGAGNYLPDFRLRLMTSREPFWFEVKGPHRRGKTDPRWAALAAQTDSVMVVATGMHVTGDDCDNAHTATAYSPNGTVAEMPLLWQRTVPRDAWDAASSARFEFGETG